MNIEKMSESQCKEAMKNGEFGDDVVRSGPFVAVILTQSWCPQWTAMKAYLVTLSPPRPLRVFFAEYDREPWYEDFLSFKEERLGNLTIPYVRYYRDGVLSTESNYVGKERFITLQFPVT